MAATNKRGVFSLETVLERQSDNHWSKIPEVFRYVNVLITAAPAFGYLAGGKSPAGDRSSVDRIDYGNDTATAAPKGTLVSNSDGGNIAGTGNQSFGYTCGTSITNVNRIDYSSDTSTSVRKGTLSSARAYISAVGNRNFGYWCGGNLSRTSFIDRLDYSNDTAASTPKGPLSRSILASAATGNFDFGYVGGLYPGMSLTERIDYSNDTAGTLDKGALIASGYMVSAAGNSNFGYWNGGSHGSRVGRLDYANDSVNAVFRGNTTFAGVKRGGTGSGNFGYMTGGDPSSVTIVDRVDYSNDTSIAAKGPLSLGKFYHAAVSAQENGLSTVPIPATRIEARPAPAGTDYGYIGGGHDGSGRLSSIDRIDIANDTATALVKGKMTVQRRGHAGTGSLTHGYQGGDDVPGSKSSVSRIDFSNDTADAAIVGRMSYAQPGGGAASGNKDFGYFVGGNVSKVSRVDYSNDSATQSSKGPLAAAMWYLGGTGNQSYGYFTGGYPAISTLNRIDYGNDTATAATKGNQSTGRYGQAASGNASYAYFAGGRSSSVTSTVDRLDYSNDTPNMVVKGPLSSTGYYISSFGNSEYGWFCARRPDKSVVDRIDFANDTATASIRGPLTATRKYAAASSSRQYNNPTTSSPTVTVDKGSDGYTVTTSGPAYGYWSGGQTGSTPKSTVDRIDYSNDSANMVSKGPLSESGFYFVGISSPAYGYTCGSLYPSYKSTVQRADYANDTATAVVKGPLSRSDGSGSGLNSRSYGYVAGGQNPGNNSYVDRIDFSNDSATASPKGNLDTGRGKCAGTSNQNYGWATGGIEPGTSKVSRIDFSNDTSTSSPKGDMNVARMGHSGSGNADYGYQAGGNNNFNSSVDRIDYSNDTATASPKGPLSLARRYVDGVSSPSYGWHAGGEYDPAGTETSTCDRIDFSSDTSTAAVKGSLTSAKAWFMGNHSSQSNDGGTSSFIPRVRWVDNVAETPAVTEGPAFGYFAGGWTGSRKSTVDRIDYSNDTPTATPKGPITIARNTGSATSNNSHGYFAGGYNGSGDLTRVDRVDYSNDTDTATAKGNLEDGRTGAGGVGNVDFGYAAGGRTPGAPSGSSQIDRIDYSNDSATALEKGNLLNGKYYYQGGVGNQSFGYFGGGRYPSPGGHSRVERMEYANDTATTVSKGPLSFVKHKTAATGTPAYGYFAGGGPTPYNTTVDRIDYANDTATASPKSTLTQGRDSLAAVSSPSHGYFGGGYTSNYISTVDKIDFSNDTATATTVGTLSSGKSSVFATSSRNDALPSTVRPAVAALVQPPFPLPTPLPVPPPPAPVPYAFDHESATSISGTIGGQSRTGTYCDPETDLATGITYGSQDSTPFDTSTDRNSEIIRCYSFTNYSGRTFAAAICALCEKPPQGGVWPISNNWESAWWIQSGNDESDILIVVFDGVKTFSGVEISSPARQYSSSNDGVYVVRLSGSASSFTTDAIGDAVYDGSTTNTISASFSAQAIAIYRSGTGGWARVGNIRFLK